MGTHYLTFSPFQEPVHHLSHRLKTFAPPHRAPPNSLSEIIIVIQPIPLFPTGFFTFKGTYLSPFVPIIQNSFPISFYLFEDSLIAHIHLFSWTTELLTLEQKLNPLQLSLFLCSIHSIISPTSIHLSPETFLITASSSSLQNTVFYIVTIICCIYIDCNYLWTLEILSAFYLSYISHLNKRMWEN